MLTNAHFNSVVSKESVIVLNGWGGPTTEAPPTTFSTVDCVVSKSLAYVSDFLDLAIESFCEMPDSDSQKGTGKVINLKP
jgi:hypothetical protein